VPVTPAAPGGFLNYQVSAQQVAGETIGGVLGEFGAFSRLGVLTNSVVGRSGDGPESLIRLDTTFTHDFPDHLETLSIGDAISDGASWGNAVRYAGVRWSSDFALRPDLLTTPLLTTGGTATVPSTVDVFVNNQLVSNAQVPAGPFIVDRLPTVSGSGDVSVVVRDALGREQVVTQSFYSSVALLAPGLTQYSVNLGSVREDYALASDQYAGLLAAGSYRRGITDTFTLEGHAEELAGSSAAAHAAGVNAAFGLGALGVFNVTLANGGDAGGSGWLTGVGIERRGGRMSFLASTAVASGEFAQVGEPASPAQRIRQRTLLQAGTGLGRWGSLSLAFVRDSYRDSPTQQSVSLTHSVNIGHTGTLNLTASRVTSGADATQAAMGTTSFYLIFVLPIDSRRSVSMTATGGSGSGAPTNEFIGAVAESPPVGPGSGYRVSASTAGNYDASWRQQFAAADLDVEAARNQGIDGRSAYVNGALTLLDGQVGATRAVNGSFAEVDVGGLPDVPVYVENQLTTHTDASGHALLFNLRPYEANRVSIAPEDLPLDTTIGASSTILAPPIRSGVVARFPVERVRGGTFRLVSDDGLPVPAGAQVKFMGKIFPVVTDGVVYVTGFDHGTGGDATWLRGHCRFRLEPPPPGDPLPDMGTVRCR
jgi:outer membrane usher protein